ncbi:MAG: penicillin acylase family protein [Wenzhouxiangellaceae bacterium]
MSKIPVKRVFISTMLSLTALLAAAWFGGRMYLENSLLVMQGSGPLAGLSQPVEVLFDGRGIPRIYAASDADAVRTLGWLHASERLFQMELLRAVARGEVSEIIGPAGLESDVLHRQYGFARRIEDTPPAITPEISGLLHAYVDGINARIGADQPLPPSFLLLGHTPRAWTVDDVLTLAFYQSWYPNTLVMRLSEAWREAARAHGAAAADWLKHLPAWGLPSIPAQRMTEASNTWTLAPSRSASGHALHAADPHLDYTMAPGLWYIAGIHSRQTLDLVGVTVPGLPFVAMGHNGTIAFAFTVAPVDLGEVYRFDYAPDTTRALLGPEGAFPIIERRESIRVRGQDQPVMRTIATTRYGLVVDRDQQGATVLQWAGFELPTAKLLENGIAINRAGDFAAFRAAASDMGALSVNWSYSDRDGNIAYVQSTPIPQRLHDTFYTTLDGSDPGNHWAGFVPPEQRPFALNPDQGWLANANNHSAVDAPWPMPGFYKHLRMRRAATWLDGREQFTPADMQAMQMDATSGRALTWKNWLANIAAETGRTRVADELRAWDGVMNPASETAGLFALWWQFLPEPLFGDSQLADWRFGRTLLDDWMNQPPKTFELASQPRRQAAIDALEQTLKRGIRPLGEIQTLRIRHPLAQVAGIDRWLGLSRGPYPVGGGPGSLNVTYHRSNESRAELYAAAGASMRFVLDWSDPDAFFLNLTLGQSGHPLSPHFDDFLPSFFSGEPWVVPFSREIVEQRSVSRLVLESSNRPITTRR